MTLKPSVSNGDFSAALTAYETTIRMAKATDRAQSALENTHTEENQATIEIFESIYDKTVSYGSGCLADLVLAPAENVEQVIVKLRHLIQDSFPILPGREEIFDQNRRSPFSENAALDRILVELTSFFPIR